MNAKAIEKEVILKIVEKLAEAEFDDLSILLDMLFVKDQNNNQRVSKQMVADFFQLDMSVRINRRDLDLFLKTHALLANKEFLTRDELRQVFEKDFRQARDRMIQ